jgi:FG-GAP-like repeat
MGLMVAPAGQWQCGIVLPAPPAPPAASAKRLEGSQVVRGQKDIAWAWLGSPTTRYPHKALGSPTHAATLHVLTQGAQAPQQELVYRLPFTRVFEDLTVRLVDIDADGRDEMIVIESDALRGSSVVVLGLRAVPPEKGTANANHQTTRQITEIARSAPTGGTFYWLNPVGVADFDGDGRQDIASVTTPHVGGILNLYHYRPPLLEPFAKVMDVSNHRMGDPEQDLAVIVQLPGLRPTVIVPDMSLKALHALRWEASDAQGSTGRWKELADVMPLPARVQRMLPMPGGACVLLADSTWLRVTLSQ